MEIIYKATTKANEYPNNKVHVQPLKSGDVIFIFSHESVKIGDRYKNYTAFISRIIYEPKKWWQFWKRKKQLGYEVTWK